MEYNIDLIIEEIINLFRDNLKLFLINDNYLINLKEYCKKDLNLKYTPYNTLIYFVEEALSDLVNCKYLFDFRDLEQSLFNVLLG